MSHADNLRGIVCRGMRIMAWPNLGSNMIDVMMSGHVGLNYAEHVVGKPIEWVPYEEHGDRPGPTLRLDPQEAQLLMDQLWNCGVRPTEGTGSAGSLRATERHLEDMRRIAYAGLNIDLATPDPRSVTNLGRL